MRCFELRRHQKPAARAGCFVERFAALVDCAQALNVVERNALQEVAERSAVFRNGRAGRYPDVLRLDRRRDLFAQPRGDLGGEFRLVHYDFRHLLPLLLHLMTNR
jgi:hypothetical protein